ncbi:MAG: carboxypeptidase regulatory-like domain-containing protein [Bryobacteraceae bacterium]|nr:carboxypeptidase regulatory-like domain-containing protein [Bryobacteraceae bacterium]
MWTRRALLGGLGVCALSLAADEPMTRLRVEVTDHKDKPVERANVLVRFVDGRSVKKFGKKNVRKWEMRTNQDGIAQFPSMPQGKVMLLVMADRFQTSGQELEILEAERTVEVKLNPPQPQYSAH